MLKKLLSVIVISTLSALSVFAQTNADLEMQFKKFNTLLYQLDRNYVDTVNLEKVVEKSIREMLQELDPHSVYIPEKELKKMNEPLEGNFEGIGIQFNILKDTITVVSPIPGGPSEKLGIRASDKIIKIEDEVVAGIGVTNSMVIERLRGKKGTIVNVSIKRRGENELLDYAIERDKIPIFSVDASYMGDDETGYIKINRFAAQTADEFREAVTKLKAQGMKNLILDLQGNGGGYLRAAVDIADELIDGNKLLVYTQGRTQPKQDLLAGQPGLFETGKLVVLVDEGSASASEIVSGAVQDWDRGLIVGRRTFGKGLVQKPFMLPDGSAVRMTVSRYYTPSGRCIQKPYKDGIEQYYRERFERYTSGEMFSLDSIELPDSLKFQTANNRTVYGGGGILPDVFVPFDTSESSSYFSAMVRKGIINDYALEYSDGNRRKLKKQFPDMVAFKAGFNVNEEMMNEMIKQAEKAKIEFVETDFIKSKNIIETRFKALLARSLYESEAFYYIINDLNESYQKALKVLQDGTYSKMKLAQNKN
ncbi:S41 family peptidase [Luteibaculum oceani]|uniref:S41 family peptidase n=1 Tax=Luteibaculum oceani TaxID=1294296 RepID=A0A5C6UUJ5_9FLAO|nr:S41 family peptidase [Luteibaculum oceani]TXC77043.1 S41 family peptidase [Luteibaculum oceani]